MIAISLLLSVVLAQGTAENSVGESLPLAIGGKTRVTSKTLATRPRSERGRLVIAATASDTAITATVVNEESCFVDTIETATIQKYRVNDAALPGGAALGGLGLLAVAGAGVAVALGQGQPALNDEFSRGELSREGVYAIAAGIGLAGIAGVGGGVAIALTNEEALGTERRERVVGTVDCPGSVGRVRLVLTQWDGPSVSADVSGGIAVFEIGAAHRVPPPRQAWATLEGAGTGDEVGGLASPIRIDPGPDFFVPYLRTVDSIEALEAFNRRFPNVDVWKSTLEPRYRDLLQRRDRALAEQHAAQVRALVSAAQWAVAQQDFVTAREKIFQADRDSTGCDDALRFEVAKIKEEIAALARKAGGLALKAAVAGVKAGRLDEARVAAALANQLGVNASTDAGFAAYEGAYAAAESRAAAAAAAAEKRAEAAAVAAQLREERKRTASIRALLPQIRSGLASFDELLLRNQYYNMVKVRAALDVLGADASGALVRSVQISSVLDCIYGSEFLDDSNVTKFQRVAIIKSTLRAVIIELIGLRVAGGISAAGIVNAADSPASDRARTGSERKAKARLALVDNGFMEYAAAKAAIDALGYLDDIVP